MLLLPFKRQHNFVNIQIKKKTKNGRSPAFIFNCLEMTQFILSKMGCEYLGKTSSVIIFLNKKQEIIFSIFYSV